MISNEQKPDKDFDITKDMCTQLMIDDYKPFCRSQKDLEDFKKSVYKDYKEFDILIKRIEYVYSDDGKYILLKRYYCDDTDIPEAELDSLSIGEMHF